METLQEAWPELPLDAWKDTFATLHRWTQVIGKVQLALTPPENHWWNVTFRVTARGLRSALIPFGLGAFEVDFDFIDHELSFRAINGETRTLALEARSVAEFYRDVMATLRSLGVEVSIWDVPVEIPDDTTPFSQDRHHASYDPEYVQRWWRALVQAHLAMTEFRARFTGKCSPVQFFWGSFDLAVTRFSGRRAPERPGADLITLESYCEEVCSVGFWPGSDATKGAAFYCYGAPAPEGFSAARVRPDAARYDTGIQEFLLSYDDVRRASEPRAYLLDFFQSTYDACADLGRWDRKHLERPLILSASDAEAARASAPP
ncbi:hypothetical protein JGU66_35245 [Myxococcaceae bacterium JPH2]|nr:hypothetical protein [Myxococcaceae bacterium JPH2]